MNKKVLPAIYSTAFWCLFVVLLFFGLYCVTAVTPFIERSGLCIKVGRGQGDGDVGTRVWGLGTWGRETRDLRHQVWDVGTRGRQIQGRGGRGM